MSRASRTALKIADCIAVRKKSTSDRSTAAMARSADCPRASDWSTRFSVCAAPGSALMASSKRPAEYRALASGCMVGQSGHGPSIASSAPRWSPLRMARPTMWFRRVIPNRWTPMRLGTPRRASIARALCACTTRAGLVLRMRITNRLPRRCPRRSLLVCRSSHRMETPGCWKTPKSFSLLPGRWTLKSWVVTARRSLSPANPTSSRRTRKWSARMRTTCIVDMLIFCTQRYRCSPDPIGS